MVCRAIRELFIRDADRTVLWIRTALATGTVFVVADDLRNTGRAFLDATLEA
jgi:hypothetical protein